jgi:hypothetical protein
VLITRAAGWFSLPNLHTLPVRWHWAGTCVLHCRYRDVEELLAERGLPVDHVTGSNVTPGNSASIAIATAAPTTNDSWRVDETYSESRAPRKRPDAATSRLAERSNSIVAPLATVSSALLALGEILLAGL